MQYIQKHPTLQIVTIIIMLFFWNTQVAVSQKMTEIRKFQSLLEQEEDSTKKAQLVSRIAITFIGINLDSCKQYAEQGLIMCQELNYEYGVAVNLGTLGDYHRKRSEYEKAIKYYQEAYLKYKKIGGKGGIRGIASIHKNNGTIHLIKSEYEKALQEYIQSLKLYEQIDRKWGIAIACNDIGVIYEHLQDYDKAIEYLQQAITTREEIEDWQGLTGSYSNISNVYSRQKKHKQAIEYLLKALALSKQVGHIENEAAFYLNLGIEYNLIRKSNKALTCLHKGLQLARKIESKQRIAEVMVGLGGHHFQFNNHDSANFYLEQGLQIAESIESDKIRKEIFYALYQMLEKQEQHQLALEYHKKFKSLADSLLNENNYKAARELNTKYEVEKKETENQSLKQQRTFIIVLSLIGIITLASIVYAYRTSLKKKKLEVLNTQNQLEITRQAKELQEQELKEVSRKVMSQAILAIEKNNLLKSLKSLITTLFNRYSRVTIHEKEKFKPFIHDLTTKLDERSINHSAQIEMILSAHENQDPDFLPTLEVLANAKLTPNDKKICVLFRAQNPHDIVKSLMKIEEDNTFRKAKARIMKKLGTTKQGRLEDFLTDPDFPQKIIEAQKQNRN